MSRVVIPWRIRFTTASPDLIANASLRRSIDGGAAEPGRESPIASPIEAIVFAVYIPPHAPSPGQIARSILSTSSCEISPRAQAPTASNASIIVTSLPSTFPGIIDPA